MKYKHTKYFFIIYAVSYLMMLLPPLYNVANKPVLVLGWPMFVMWILLWSLVASVAMLVNYRLDVKSGSNN